jgi:serine/threonine-protein kinase HipA
MIDNLIVSLDFRTESRDVGTLVRDERKIYFRYHEDFLQKGHSLSPFKLPFTEGIQTPSVTFFDGLFGVFSDSLPDGWGRLVIDRALQTRGKSLDEITILDRLAYVGNSGMGALTYRPAHETTITKSLAIDLDLLADASQNILTGASTDIIEELVNLGGSSGGARPKILVGFNPKTETLMHGTTNLPQGFEHWLIKFPATIDPADVAVIEFAYHQMAVAAGLEMAPCRLFTGASARQYFGTKRFDRTGNDRLHLHSAAGLMHDNFRLSNMDYGHIMDAAFRLENSVVAYEKVLRLAAFNVFSHNRDDHSKNISFLMNSQGEWRLAPAYDLTFSRSAHGFHSMTIAGESKAPGEKELLSLAETFGLRKPHRIIEEVRTAIGQWREIARDNGVSTTTIAAIEREIG